MEKIRKYSQQEKEKIVKKYLNSGMYATKFIVDYNIPIKTFYKWVKIYKDKQPGFIDVTDEVKNNEENNYVEEIIVPSKTTSTLIEVEKNNIIFRVTFDQIPKLLEVLK